VREPSQVVTIAQFDIGDSRVQLTTGRAENARQALEATAALLEAGTLVIPVQTFPFSRAAQAHEISQSGHVRGKLVLVPES